MTHEHRTLSERVVTLQALYRLGLAPQDALEMLVFRGWTQREIQEAIQVMRKRLGPDEREKDFR